MTGRPRVLLVDPYLAREDPMERKFIELYPSLGLLTLGAYLRDAGAEVRLVDLTFEKDLRALHRALASFHPEIVGVHTKTLTMRRATEVARAARAAGAVVVAGGPDAATRTGLYLSEGFDIVVPAEGEPTLVDLAERVHRGDRDLAGTPGTVVRREGKLVRGPPRPLLRDLDRLPLPAWELLDMERYLATWERATGERRAAVLTSRGCPFDCAWCSKPTFGRTFRQQSPERVLAELRALKERYRVDFVRFCDDVFGIHRGWLERLLAGLREEALDLRFECLARVDLLKPDLLDSMRAAGLARVYVGVESGSQKMLDLMNRGTKLAQVEAAATALRRAGIRQFWFLMLGYPGETEEDIEATLRLFRRFSPEEYSVSIAVPIPGTRFHDRVQGSVRTDGPRKAETGGRSLLFEAAFPERFYRWQQRRFDLEAALGRSRRSLAPEVAERIGKAADRFHERVATKLLVGAPPRPRRAPSGRARPRG